MTVIVCGVSRIAAVAFGDWTRSTFGPSSIAVSVTTTPFSRVALPSSAEAASWAAAGNAMADAWRHMVRKAFKEGACVIKIASHFAPDEVRAGIEEAHLLGLKVTCHCKTIYTEMKSE